jgi:hypothetical protein
MATYTEPTPIEIPSGLPAFVLSDAAGRHWHAIWHRTNGGTQAVVGLACSPLAAERNDRRAGSYAFDGLPIWKDRRIAATEDQFAAIAGELLCEAVAQCNARQALLEPDTTSELETAVKDALEAWDIGWGGGPIDLNEDGFTCDRIGAIADEYEVDCHALWAAVCEARVTVR